MDRPKGQPLDVTRVNWRNQQTSTDFTVQHVGLAVGEAEAAGIQQVRSFDGGFGEGDPAQTQHL